VIGDRQPFIQGDQRRPSQKLGQTAIVAVSTSHTLRPGKVVPLSHGLSSDLGYQVNQFVNSDHNIHAQVQRVRVIRPHDAVDALNTVIYVHKGAGLLASVPHLNFVTILGQGQANGLKKIGPASTLQSCATERGVTISKAMLES
jgi:hypothetical protein